MSNKPTACLFLLLTVAISLLVVIVSRDRPTPLGVMLIVGVIAAPMAMLLTAAIWAVIWTGQVYGWDFFFPVVLLVILVVVFSLPRSSSIGSSLPTNTPACQQRTVIPNPIETEMAK